MADQPPEDSAQQRFEKAWRARLSLAAKEHTLYSFRKIIATSISNDDYHAYQVKHNTGVATRQIKKDYPHGFVVLLGINLRPDLSFRDDPSLDKAQESHSILIKEARGDNNTNIVYPSGTSIPVKHGALLAPVSTVVPSEFAARVAVSCSCPDFAMRGSAHTTKSAAKRQLIDHSNLYSCKHMMMVNKHMLGVDFVPLQIPDPWKAAFVD